MRLNRLLAERIDKALGRVPHPDEQVVRPLPHQVGDIVGEAGLRALVRNACLHAVHEHLRAEVNSVEAENQPAAGNGIGGKSAAVLDHLAGGCKPSDAGKRGLDRERNEDFACDNIAHYALGIVGDDGIVPRSVEGCPAIAHHLRTRIFAPGVLGGYFFSERSHHRSRDNQTEHLYTSFPFRLSKLVA